MHFITCSVVLNLTFLFSNWQTSGDFPCSLCMFYLCLCGFSLGPPQTLTDAKNAIGLGSEAGHLLPATSSPHDTEWPDARWLMHVTCHTAAHHTVALCRTAEPAACYAVAECQAPAAGHLPPATTSRDSGQQTLDTYFPPETFHYHQCGTT